MNRRASVVVTILSPAALLIPGIASAHPADLSATTIVQRSMQAMQSVHGDHSEATIRTSTAAIARRPAQTIAAHTSVDCTGSQRGTHFTSAIRATITGTAVAGTAKPLQFTVHYIILSSGSTTGVGVHTTFWERDARTGGRWHHETTIAQQQAYTALFVSQPCAGGGTIFRETQLPGSHLQVPVRGTSQGRPVWVLQGTSGQTGERFIFRILIDSATYTLAGFKNQYVERISGHVVARQRTSTLYSGYGSAITIAAPAAGATSP